MKTFISYVRLSKKQHSGDYYGLDAQRQTITEEVSRHHGTILKEYCEIESGTRKGKRTEIFKALRHAKEAGATLIVAKLDRLSRDSEFILNVINSGADILFCDFKFEGIAGKMMLTIIAAFAEYEAARISQRTKDGLAIAKSRGVKLGNPHLNHSAAARASSLSRRSTQNLSPNIALKGRIELMRHINKMSLTQIADTLNNEGLRTTRNKPFNEIIIHRILKPINQ